MSCDHVHRFYFKSIEPPTTSRKNVCICRYRHLFNNVDINYYLKIMSSGIFLPHIRFSLIHVRSNFSTLSRICCQYADNFCRYNLSLPCMIVQCLFFIYTITFIQNIFNFIQHSNAFTYFSTYIVNMFFQCKFMI